MREVSRKKNKFKIKDIILNDIQQNLRQYIIVTIIFLLGIVCGVIFINNINETQTLEIKEYISNFINSLKGNYQIDKMELLKSSLLDNLKLVFGMWFIGSTVVGMPIVLGIVLWRGFCIGYTVSSTIAILRCAKRCTVLYDKYIFTNNYLYTSDTCFSC